MLNPALKSELAQTWMIVRSTAERPMKFALAFLNRRVIDAGDAQAHQACLIELPVLIAIAAKPVAAVVVPFIGEAHGDAVVVKGPNLLDQAIVEFALPFAGQEGLDGRATLQELGAIPPPAIGRIGERDPGWIARVPGILGQARPSGWRSRR